MSTTDDQLRQRAIESKFLPGMRFVVKMMHNDPLAHVIVATWDGSTKTTIRTVTRAAADAILASDPSSYEYDDYMDIPIKSIVDGTIPLEVKINRKNYPSTPNGTCLTSSQLYMWGVCHECTDLQKADITINAFLNYSVESYTGEKFFKVHVNVKEGQWVTDLSWFQCFLERHVGRRALATEYEGVTDCTAAAYWAHFTRPSIGHEPRPISFTFDEYMAAIDEGVFEGLLRETTRLEESMGVKGMLANHASAFAVIKLRMMNKIQKGTRVRFVLIPESSAFYDLSGVVGTAVERQGQRWKVHVPANEARAKRSVRVHVKHLVCVWEGGN